MYAAVKLPIKYWAEDDRPREKLITKGKHLLSNAELLATSEECLLVGDGALRYADQLGGLRKVEVADQSFAYPSAPALVTLAHARALREDFVQPSDLSPLYLRRPDVDLSGLGKQLR